MGAEVVHRPHDTGCAILLGDWERRTGAIDTPRIQAQAPAASEWQRQQAARLARWRAGAQGLPKAPQPPATDPPHAAKRDTAPVPENFPFIQLPDGQFIEANPAQALQRARRAEERALDLPELGFRSSGELPEDAPARELSSQLQSAIERAASPDSAEAVAEARLEAARAEAAAEAAAALFARQRELLQQRVARLGDLVQLVAGRYGGVPEPADSPRIDARS